ncbi:hypothetical protein PROFUN_00861 [Planoprotostelium fungivorum]|uniref:DNA mismatch repair protein n=1 Tax=Planoprotostelium fungivorum TaxID=1890364 RepID=A0A2P6P087_9EUKA|nr:hypothetical protein PROFUN_00861 [Planoprotostelium fungivorum]
MNNGRNNPGSITQFGRPLGGFNREITTSSVTPQMVNRIPTPQTKTTSKVNLPKPDNTFVVGVKPPIHVQSIPKPAIPSDDIEDGDDFLAELDRISATQHSMDVVPSTPPQSKPLNRIQQSLIQKSSPPSIPDQFQSLGTSSPSIPQPSSTFQPSFVGKLNPSPQKSSTNTSSPKKTLETPQSVKDSLMDIPSGQPRDNYIIRSPIKSIPVKTVQVPVKESTNIKRSPHFAKKNSTEPKNPPKLPAILSPSLFRGGKAVVPNGKAKADSPVKRQATLNGFLKPASRKIDFDAEEQEQTDDIEEFFEVEKNSTPEVQMEDLLEEDLLEEDIEEPLTKKRKTSHLVSRNDHPTMTSQLDAKTSQVPTTTFDSSTTPSHVTKSVFNRTEKAALTQPIVTKDSNKGTSYNNPSSRFGIARTTSEVKSTTPETKPTVSEIKSTTQSFIVKKAASEVKKIPQIISSPLTRATPKQEGEISNRNFSSSPSVLKFPDDPDYDPTTLYIPDDAWKDMTPAKRQYYLIKKDNYDVIIFFQQGSFYNVFERDADVCHKQLGWAYTRGINKPVNHYTAGCSCEAFHKWTHALIDMGYKVGKVDQKSCDDEKKNDAMEREMERIFSPATITDGEFLPQEAVYLLSCCESDDEKIIGFCLLDASTGHFQLGYTGDHAFRDPKRAHLDRLLLENKPREVILKRGRDRTLEQRVKLNVPGVSIEKISYPYHQDVIDEIVRKGLLGELPKVISDLSDMEEISKNSFSHLSRQQRNTILDAFGGCVQYLRNIKMDQILLKQLNIDEYFGSEKNNMVLDGEALRNLSVLEDSSGSTNGSLFSVFDHCVSPSGKSMMRRWISRPLYRIEDIEERYDVVDTITRNRQLVKLITGPLSELPNMERLCSSFQTRPTPQSLVSIVRGIRSILRAVTGVHEYLEENFVDCSLLERMVTKEGERLRSKVRRGRSNVGQFPDIDDVWSYFSDGFDYKEDCFEPKLGSIREYDECSRRMKEVEEKMENFLGKFKETFLKISKKDAGVDWSNDPKLGRCIEINLKKVKDVPKKFPANFEVKSLKNSTRLVPPELKIIFEERRSVEEEHLTVSNNLIFQISQKFQASMPLWRRLFDVASSLDCLVSLFQVSEGLQCVRPQLIEEKERPVIRIVDMIHPCIHSGATGTPIPVSVTVGGDEPIMMILTGPNMGGKSTSLRTTCITIIMAQIGSFVPSSSCHITPVDRIFVRLGCNDNIMNEQSTFMVELGEASTILRNASNRSLVILDELGRGTSTFDGYAIAYSVVNHFVGKKKRMMFATHYHNLTKEFGREDDVSCYQMSCIEDEGRVVFTYQMVEGIAPNSYGMNVARLAGVSEEIIARAERIATEMEVSDTLRETKKMQHSDWLQLWSSIRTK